MASNGGVGRLWVAVDANIAPAMTKLRELDAQALKTAHHLNSMGSGSSGAQTAINGMTAGLKAANAEASAVSKGVSKIGLSAVSANSPMKALQASMYRTSQAFINMRYGNPIGAIAGLSQAGTSAAQAMMGLSRGAGASAVAIGEVAVAAAAAAPVIAGLVLTGIGAKIAADGVQAAATLEQLTISFEGLLGSTQRAAAEVRFLQQLSTTSVVPTDQIMEADRQLLAFGITADDTRQKLVTFLSDYGSAVNLSTGQVQGLAYVIGQINAQGKAYTQDIKQLANASIGVDKLAKSLGMSQAEFSKLVSSGKASAALLLPAIMKIGDGSKETAAKMAKSAKGMITNIKDVYNVRVGNAFGKMLEDIKPLIAWVQDFINAFNFQHIADAWQQVVGYFKQAMGDMGADAEGTAASISQTIAKAVNLIGYLASIQFMVFRSLWNTFMAVVNGVWAGIQEIVGQVLQKLGSIIEVASYVPGPWQDAMKSATESIQGMANAALEGANIAGGAFVNSAAAAGNAWGSLFSNFPKFKEVAYGKNIGYTPGSKGYNITPTPVMTNLPSASTDGSKKKDKELQKWKNWLSEIRKVIDDSKSAFKELRALTARFTAGELSKIEEAFRFGGKDGNYQGDVAGIISMYDDMTEKIRKFYALYTKYGSKASRKAAADERDQMIKKLRGQAEQLVKLARQNEQYAKDLETWQAEESARVQGQIDSLNNLYNGYNDARGYAVKGAIQNAQDLLDAATQAYDDANAKLQDLISARDDFLAGVRDSARSFVNALETTSETIAAYTRLDSAGSFLMEEKQKTASLKDQMAQRLEVLKAWSANIKTLIARGLNGTLLQDLVAAGPEAAGAAVQQLVDGAQTGIDEVNAIQNELATVVAGLQTTASSQWFDAGISAQQQSVNALAAAKTAAETTLRDTQAQYNMQLAQLQAYQASVEAGTDENSKRLTALMQQNDAKAAEIAASIQKKFEWLTDRENNDKNLYDLGVAAIDGLIKGLESKEDLVVATAKRIAAKVSSTIANALKIQSPSKVMEGYGNYIGEGLAIGMESSLSKVEAAALVLSGGTLPSTTPATSGFQPSVQVFIGDRELTDLVDMRIKVSDGQSLDYVSAGRRI